MAISQPLGTDFLNSPDHALSHRIIASDPAAPVQSLVVISTGNVGIGTTNPAVNLDVNGIINAATGIRIAGAATSGQYLRGSGTNFVPSAIQAADVPTLNHNTLDNLTVGDAHTHYALLAGRSGGQIITGGTLADNTLTIRGNSAASGNTATVANMIFNVGNSGGTTAMTILNNGLVYVGSPMATLTQDQFAVKKDWTEGTRVTIENKTAHASTYVGLRLVSDNGSAMLSLKGSLSAAYGAYVANSVAIYSAVSNGFIFMSDNVGAPMVFATGGSAERWRFDGYGSLTNTGGNGSAYIHLKAGTATAGTAPIKLTSGTLLTTPEAGTIEYLSNRFYLRGTDGLSVAGNVGIGTTAPATKLDIAGSMQVSSAVVLSLGGYVRTFAEAIGTPSGTTTYFDIAVAVPSGCKLLGAQLRVDTALTAGETWSAAYVTGSTTSLAAAGTAVAKNTKVNKMHIDEITSATTNIRITRDAGNFTNAVGVIRAIVYYETFTAMGNAA